MNRKTKKSTTKMNDCAFFETASMFEENWTQREKVNALREHATGAGRGILVLGCDMYNFKITGDISANLNASSCNSPTHSGPSLLILNDQGGDVMNVDENVTSTLRAQDHGHPPVVCFEPGILRRDCSAGNRAYIDICSTLRAQMGDNQPAGCYESK